MAPVNDARDANDPFDLDRFLEAQEADYEDALTEIKEGEKRTHWMWYIFPQIDQRRLGWLDLPLRRRHIEKPSSIDFREYCLSA